MYCQYNLTNPSETEIDRSPNEHHVSSISSQVRTQVTMVTERKQIERHKDFIVYDCV